MGNILKITIIFALFLLVYTEIKRAHTTPVVIPGATTIRIDTVVVRDTIVTVFTRKEIAVTKEIIMDTIDNSPHNDTAVGYGISEDYPNGVHIGARLYSRHFSEIPPVDLRGIIDYRPGNDTFKTVFRTDSVVKNVYKPPIIPTWEAVIIGLTAGTIVTLILKK
jgi:hypothetical protein